MKGTFIDERVRVARADDFDLLLMKAGVDVEDLPAGETLSTYEANTLVQLLRFKIADGNMPAYGPRIMASFLLEEAIKEGASISRLTLTERLRRYTYLAVLNPEGHLVRAYTGTPLMCVGPLHIQNGVPGAEGFRVDAFYVQEGNSFHEDKSLVAPAIFERPKQQIVSNGSR